MSVLSTNETSFTGSGSLIQRTFSDTSRRDCARGSASTWDSIRLFRESIEKLKDENNFWIELRNALEEYCVETAGELPKDLYEKFRRELDKPPIVMN